MSRKIRRHFTDDFKQQIVDLHTAGMKRSALIKEYDLTPSEIKIEIAGFEPAILPLIYLN